MTDARPTGGALTRLRLVGLVAPLVFVALLLGLRPLAVERFGVPVAHTALGTTLILCATAFGWAMYRLLGSAHDAVVEAERRAAALAERDRIARELHDSLAQVLGVAHLRLRALAGRPAVALDERARAEVDELAGLCHEAYRDVREAILGLKEAGRPDRTLLEHLDSYVAAFSRTSAIETTLHADPGDELGLSPAAEVQVIRVIQEALTNVRKHSGASRAAVRLAAGDDHTEIVVEDDGTGFDPHRGHHPDGFGLSAMRERTESVSGRLTIDSSPGRGTRVVVHLPGRRGATLPATPEELSA